VAIVKAGLDVGGGWASGRGEPRKEKRKGGEGEEGVADSERKLPVCH